MTPVQLTLHLRAIAARVDSSPNPSQSAVTNELNRVIAALDASPIDPQREHELEKKNKELLKTTQDDLGKQMEDLVAKGVAGDDITKAVGEMERKFKDLERKTQIR